MIKCVKNILLRLKNYFFNPDYFDPVTDLHDPIFLQWAFGPKYWSLKKEQKKQFWNHTHGELFKFSEKDEIHEYLPLIRQHWQEYKKTSKNNLHSNP